PSNSIFRRGCLTRPAATSFSTGRESPVNTAEFGSNVTPSRVIEPFCGHPYWSTATPGGVPGQRSMLSGTPSWSLSGAVVTTGGGGAGSACAAGGGGGAATGGG